MTIAKIAPTTLLSPLGSSDTSVIVTAFIDSKGNTVTFSQLAFLAIVVKSGSTSEIIKISAITQNSDGSATLTVASSGRNIDPTTPYAGYSTGTDFPAGADVIVTNDPLTMSRFVQLDNANTFTVTPTTTAGDPTDPTAFTRKAYVDALVLGTLTTIDVIVPGTAGATVAAGNLVYLDTATGKWKLARADQTATVDDVLLGIAQGSGTDGTAITSGVLLQGEDQHQSGMTGGNVMYASNTPGAISSSAGTETVTIGIAKDATNLYFAPRFNMQLTKTGNDFILALPGMVFPYTASSAPSGFLLCDGSAVSRTTYAALFAVIGTGYGTGDGSTTFNVPDLRGRSIIGAGTGSKVFTFASRSSDTITVTGSTNANNNSVQTGQAVTYHSTSSVMTGLSNDTIYYLIRIAYNQFKLASTLANAQNGTQISLSSDGSGTQTFTLALSARTNGDYGGEETHAMSSTELLAHTHGSIVGTTGSLTVTQNSAGSGWSNGGATASTGGNAAMNVMSPFAVLTHIIKT